MREPIALPMPGHRKTDDRAEIILEALTRRVRLITVDQAADTWWWLTVRPRTNAKKCLRKLERQGLVEFITIMAMPEIDLGKPVFEWHPGNPPPKFGPIAYRLRTRWNAPLVPTEAVIATIKAKRLYGGYIGGRKPRRSEATHDVHLTQVYLRLRRTNPEFAAQWVSDAQQYAEGGGKNARLPDAVIREGTSVHMLIEFAGAYSKQKLEAFHGQAKRYPYQLW